MDVSTTASAVTALGTLNTGSLIAYGVAALLGLILAPTHQAIIEGLLARFPLPFWVKPFVPSALASIIGSASAWALKSYGVTPQDALAAAASLASFTHLFNASPWAADLEAKALGALKAPVAKAAAQVVPMLLLAAFLGLGAGLHAEVALSYGGLFGSSTWTAGPGGTFRATGSTLGGAEINAAYGSVSGTTFSPDVVLALGGAWEDYDGNQYGDVILGLGPTIPGTTAPLIVGPAWRMFTGERYPALMVGTTFDFGNPFWVGK